jgi:hypothetical protein
LVTATPSTRIFSWLEEKSSAGPVNTLTNYLLLGREGVINSVDVRRRALAALGEAGSMFMDSGLYGGTFSLFESPSKAEIDVRMRFGFGVWSGV